MGSVTPPDLEAWLTTYLRSSLTGVQISNKEPSPLTVPLVKPLIVVRDDSGQKLGYTTFDRSVGISVLAGSKQNDKPSNDLARSVAAILFDDQIALAEGSPIAAVTWSGCNGPYAIADSLDVARRYMTAQYVVIGAY